MKPYRSGKYLAWIRRQPCARCGRPAGEHGVHAHHEPLGENFVAGKAPDTHAMPLCAECHNQRHGCGPSFLQEAIDVKMTIIRLLTRYLSAQGKS
jgi:hypothetical protein